MEGKLIIAHDRMGIQKARQRHADRRDLALAIAQKALTDGDWAAFKGWVAAALDECRRIEGLDEACTIEGQSLSKTFREQAGDLFDEAISQKGNAGYFLDGCLSLLTAAEEIEKEELE